MLVCKRLKYQRYNMTSVQSCALDRLIKQHETHTFKIYIFFTITLRQGTKGRKQQLSLNFSSINP